MGSTRYPGMCVIASKGISHTRFYGYTLIARVCNVVVFESVFCRSYVRDAEFWVTGTICRQLDMSGDLASSPTHTHMHTRFARTCWPMCAYPYLWRAGFAYHLVLVTQAGVFPATALVSPVADVVRRKLATVGWGRRGLGMPPLPVGSLFRSVVHDILCLELYAISSTFMVRCVCLCVFVCVCVCLCAPMQ